MAISPMQRKSRNSFLLGMLLMLVIAAIIVAFLFIQLKNYRDKEAEELAASVNICVLNQNVKSGQIITSDMLSSKTVNRNLIPANAIGDVATLENYNLQDREGNIVSTRYDEENDKSTMYLTRDGRDYQLNLEEGTQSYYITVNNEREYVELNSIPVVAKVDMNKNTVITRDLVTSADNTTTADVRQEEFNMIVLPTQLGTGDYVDIRLVLPTGQNYIVVSKKEVTVPEIEGVPSVDTIWMNLTEADILMINNAIVEAYYIDGAKLYANIYTEPGIQQAAITTYTPSAEVDRLIQSDPNIVDEAKQALRSRYNADQRNNIINGAIGNNADTGDESVRAGVEEDATTARENRQDYLDGLASQATTTTTSTSSNTTNTSN